MTKYEIKWQKQFDRFKIFINYNKRLPKRSKNKIENKIAYWYFNEKIRYGNNKNERQEKMAKAIKEITNTIYIVEQVVSEYEFLNPIGYFSSVKKIEEILFKSIEEKWKRDGIDIRIVMNVQQTGFTVLYSMINGVKKESIKYIIKKTILDTPT